jgi:hypothetical protein
MDFKIKQQMVEEISAEVSDLHPLLKSVLGKLENITSVEYTHGTQEKGADFVLTRFDPALSSFSYIGVVVKKGKISNDITDLSRQVEECSLPRLLDGGKRRERLSEIWVINTSTISSNAKDKIYDNYTKQRIEFIDGFKLTQLVDKHASFFWHQVPSPLGVYLDTLNRRMDSLEKEAGNVGGIACDGFYIEPDIQEIDRYNYKKKAGRLSKPRLVNLAEEIPKSSASILQADMGFGKSKILRKLTQHFAATERFNEHRVIPVNMAFRKLKDQKLTLSQLIQNELGNVLPELGSEKYRILIALDGIDEAAINGDWKEYVKSLISEARADERFRLIMATRPLHVIDEDVDLFSGAKKYLVRPLSIAKIVLFVESACQSISVPKKIYDDLRRSDLFKQLPQSPIAAALLSSLIAQNQNDLPSNLTELYAKSTEYMLGRWDVQKGRTPEKEYAAAERIALLLAEYMVSNHLIWMSLDEAQEMLKDWHSKRNTGVELHKLEERVFHTSGIFILDSDDRKLSFRHRSFGEFLYAKAATTKPELIVLERAFHAYWVECSFFFIGLKQDCTELLQGLFDLRPQDEHETWLKILVLPDYALAGYQTEYSIVEENLYKLFIEAAVLYRDIRSSKIKSRLVNLPEMHLLWLFQRVLRYSYNYEYLRKSITSTILKIDSSNIDHDDKLYALFFASCFAAQLSEYSGFQYLLKTYPVDSLPLQISIAIDLENKSNKDFSKLPLVKAHEKRLRSLLQPQRQGNYSKSGTSKSDSERETRLTELFEKPVKLTQQKLPKQE